MEPAMESVRCANIGQGSSTLAELVVGWVPSSGRSTHVTGKWHIQNAVGAGNEQARAAYQNAA
jgi:hypothetical protein